MAMSNLLAFGTPHIELPFRVGKHRHLAPEIMDNPALESSRHVVALHGLARMNALSRSAQTLWQPIQNLARAQKRDRLRVLDIATGSGDVPLRLWRLARRSGIYLEIVGLDISSRALRFAQERAHRAGARIEFRQLNPLEEDLPNRFDVITTSLFLHHLEDASVIKLLAKMKQAARRLVLAHDLVRETGGLWLAFLATHLFSTSDVVHADALQSVRAAFTVDEIRKLAFAAGLDQCEIKRLWPYRYLLCWQRP